MNNQQLREALRPLAEALSPTKAMDAERRVREGFRDDGLIDASVIAGGLPPQRIDYVIPASTADGIQPGRFVIPEGAMATRLTLTATSNAGSTFGVSLLVNGISRASGSIRVGTDRSSGLVTISLPAGSIISFQTLASIPQGVTVSVFYRPVEV